jgi:hypothetical protein
MRRIAVVLFTVASVLIAQDDPTLLRVPIDGLPSGTRVVAQSVLQTRSGSILAVEAIDPDGVAAFFLLDYTGTGLSAREVGPFSIPGDLAVPPTHRPVVRRIEGTAQSVWPVRPAPATDGSTGGASEYVSAPALASLRFAEIDDGPWQLSPSSDSALAIRSVSLRATGAVDTACVLEPNIIIADERLASTGAWRVRAIAQPHLLVGVAVGGDRGRRIGFRLYTPRGELVATTDHDLAFDPNLVPDVVLADLTGDGVREVIAFATDPDAVSPIVVYRFARRDGAPRVLSFSLCSPRMNGDDVRSVQRALVRAGFAVGPNGIDGWYGPDTRAAVIRFQRSRSMPVTGVVDDAVRAALE